MTFRVLRPEGTTCSPLTGSAVKNKVSAVWEESEGQGSRGSVPPLGADI